jgi:hypothetical protein
MPKRVEHDLFHGRVPVECFLREHFVVAHQKLQTEVDLDFSDVPLF